MLKVRFLIALLATICIIGAVCAGFLWALHWVTIFRMLHPEILYLLPFAGLFSVFLYKKISLESNRGNFLVFESVKNSHSKIPLAMAPLVFFGTILTHLFGGSAGREGTALQMSAALGEALSNRFKLPTNHRKIILRCALAAGFSAVFGTLLTGAVFALEVLAQPKKEWRHLPFTIVSAFIANAFAEIFHPPHAYYPNLILTNFSLNDWLKIIVCAVIFGICARLFTGGLHFTQKFFSKIAPNAYPKIFIGGLLTCLLTFFIGNQNYNGLGLPIILSSFKNPASPESFAIKLLLTIITLSAGFKGGEVTPLFFIGATLGSALSVWMGLPTEILAAMGFVCVFAGAAKTPLACALMAAELFGWPTFFLALPLTFLSVFISGKIGIYHEENPAIKSDFNLNAKNL